VLSFAGAGTICCDEGVRGESVPAGLLEEALAEAEACCLVSPGNNEVIPLLTRLATRRGVGVYFGLGRTQIEGLGMAGLRSALAGPVALLIANRAEATKLTGRQDVSEALAALRGVGDVRCVVITDGADGMHGLGDEGYLFVEPYSDGRAVVDDVGAGDAAQGAIGHCLIEGWGLYESMRAGARMGFEACTARGATTALVGSDELLEHTALTAV
jgi:sugar/nucleoside kinase (ribokinase family)